MKVSKHGRRRTCRGWSCSGSLGCRRAPSRATAAGREGGLSRLAGRCSLPPRWALRPPARPPQLHLSNFAPCDNASAPPPLNTREGPPASLGVAVGHFLAPNRVSNDFTDFFGCFEIPDDSRLSSSSRLVDTLLVRLVKPYDEEQLKL